MIKQWWSDFKRITVIDQRWLSIWLLIYVTFIMLDVIMPGFWGSNLIKYIGIFLCGIYAFRKYRKDTTLICALFLTFLADTILVWTKYELFGVFVFCFAQFMHMLRLTKAPAKSIFTYAIVICAIYIFALWQGILPLYAISTIYAFELFANLVLSHRNYKKDKDSFNTRCAFYGFSAFIACDACVGLRHLMLDGVIVNTFLPLVAFLVWVFYYPSQVLLANSSDTPRTDKLKPSKEHLSAQIEK